MLTINSHPATGHYFSRIKKTFAVTKCGAWVCLSIVLVFNSCRVSLIADRDEVFIEHVLETALVVDAFYLQLMSADTSQIQYSTFSDNWNNAELEIRQLRLMAGNPSVESRIFRNMFSSARDIYKIQATASKK